MATGSGLICKLGPHIAIEGADRIVQVNMFGETVITQKGNVEGTLGVLLDMETQLSHEMAHYNNLYSNSELNVDKTQKGYLADNRRIRPVKLKGVKCSAFWMPISSLLWVDGEIPFVEGAEITVLNGKEICNRYVTPAQQRAIKAGMAYTAPKSSLVPTFKEHIDTAQWGKNIHRIKEGDTLIITEKLHGTSARVGRLRVNKTSKTNKVLAWLFNLLRVVKLVDIPVYEYCVGSRRVVKTIGGEKKEGASYYKEDIWSLAAGQFKEKLHKGETIYGEIVGYLPDGGLIMPSHDNSKLEKFMEKGEYKKFIERYGKSTKFTYGCVDNKGQLDMYDIYVYRITTTNEDGVQLDYSWEQVKGRCEELGVKHVPELAKFKVCEWPNEDGTKYLGVNVGGKPAEQIVEEITNDHSELFPNHLREGVCIRVESKGFVPQIYKSKSYLFKVLEGIIKDNEAYVDVEETN